MRSDCRNEPRDITVCARDELWLFPQLVRTAEIWISICKPQPPVHTDKGSCCSRAKEDGGARSLLCCRAAFDLCLSTVFLNVYVWTCMWSLRKCIKSRRKKGNLSKPARRGVFCILRNHKTWERIHKASKNSLLLSIFIYADITARLVFFFFSRIGTVVEQRTRWKN